MAYRKLGLDEQERRAMLANLVKELIRHEKIETTETRAKEARRMAEKMITYAKKNTLVTRRLALGYLHNDKEIVKKLFDEIGPKYKDRNGGYTRILKLTERRGDDALMVILELV